jgi:hypothetical protein
MRPRLVVLKLVAVAAVVAIVAAAPMAETASAHPARGRCVQVRASVLKSLRAGLRPTVRPQLGSAQAVEARGPFTLPSVSRAGSTSSRPISAGEASPPGSLAGASCRARRVRSDGYGSLR